MVASSRPVHLNAPLPAHSRSRRAAWRLCSAQVLQTRPPPPPLTRLCYVEAPIQTCPDSASCQAAAFLPDARQRGIDSSLSSVRAALKSGHRLPLP
eukprot:6205425-Pleurochrysis_carterae.AAC.1